MRRSGALVADLLVRSLVLFAFWFMLVDDPDQPDLFTGIATAIGVAAFTQVVTSVRGSRVRVTPSMLRRLPRTFLLLFADTGRVILALLRTIGGHEVRSRVLVAPYRATSTADPEANARRLLTQWGASLGANRYVLGIDPDRELLIVHELTPAAGPLDPLELG